jgi:hydroxymethylbilane synthase
LQIELESIKTTGDKIQDVPLAKVGGKGLFVKEIEEALLAGEVDLAVHSMKDVPSILPDGLVIGVILRREDPRDVLISPNVRKLSELTAGSRVGTSSLRRAAQVQRLCPDVKIENLRGNLDTRLRKVREGLYEAIILAAAGLHRMGWQDRITSYLDPEEFLPAIGQGAIGIEIREDNHSAHELLAPLHHVETAIAVEAERSFLKELEGGCQVPIGGHAQLTDDVVHLDGLVASLDGKEVFRLRRTERASLDQARSLGNALARELLDAGAQRILDEVYHHEA